MHTVVVRSAFPSQKFLIFIKSYEIKVVYLSITGGFGHGTGRRYVLWGTGTVRGYVRYGGYGTGGTVRGYGTGVWYRGRVWGVRYGGTVWGVYGTGVRYGGTSYRYTAPHLGNSTTFPENRYGGYTLEHNS